MNERAVVLAINGGSSNITRGPEVMTYLARLRHLSVDEVEHLLTHRASGSQRLHPPRSGRHHLTYRRSNRRNIHVRNYKEQGTVTTPCDMAVLSDLDRFHLASDALARLPHLGIRGDAARIHLHDELAAHRAYVRGRGEELPEIREWRRPDRGRASS